MIDQDDDHAASFRTPQGQAVKARWAQDAQESAGRLVLDERTGEIIPQRIEYREGNNTALLPWGMTPSDVPASACRNDFVQVCRAFLQSVRDQMSDDALSIGARLLWLDTLIDADPDSGSVRTTCSAAADRYGCKSTSTPDRWMKELARTGLVNLEVTGAGRGRETVITIVNYAEIVRLDFHRRIALGAEQMRLKRRVTEEEFVVRRRVIEEFG